MELRDKVAVVTGGAGGIGKALAWRFVEEGARGVVVADLEAADPGAVAEQLGDRALGFAGDVSDEPTVRALIAAAEEAFGPVDLFCANAGVAIGVGLEADEAVWDTAFGVNIRSHIYAAKALVPGWIERGGGYFLTTASAAGLLTQIGSAPYAVTKHAAVAFAEWLSVTYGSQGIRASCLCPMGVNTAMLNVGVEGDNSVTAGDVVRAAGAVVEPEQVADDVIAALRDERFLVLPHPEVLTFFQRKGTDYDRWLSGMRRLQAAVTGV
ncbi:MAG: putative short-chain type dehydrogenase/reductase y4lA [Solirubrobacterales bacterium]|nr:putative short-chain type dehydrogenase/reductase y4lA [Solirubrobacterales bacterium]